jgi:hypothetical protein
MEVLFDIQPEPLAERIVVRVHRDGGHRGCAAGGVIVDRQRRGVDVATKENRQKLPILARRG